MNIEILRPAIPALFAELWGLYAAGGMPASVPAATTDWLLEQGYIELSYRTGPVLQTTHAGDRFVKTELAGDKQLVVYYTERPETVRERDPEDSWDQGVTDLNGHFDYAEVLDRGADINSSYWHAIALPRGLTGNVFLVWCKYGTGSTFGKTHGQFGLGGIAVDDAGVDWLTEVLKTQYSDYFGGVEATFVETITI